MTYKKWTGGERYPEWEKKKGETLEGVFIEARQNIGPNNSNLYVVEQAGGEKINVWGDSILDNFFQHIAKGSMVKVKYLGKEKSEKRKGAEYHNYALEYDESTAPVDELAKEVFK